MCVGKNSHSIRIPSKLFKVKIEQPRIKHTQKYQRNHSIWQQFHIVVVFWIHIRITSFSSNLVYFYDVVKNSNLFRLTKYLTEREKSVKKERTLKMAGLKSAIEHFQSFVAPIAEVFFQPFIATISLHKTSISFFISVFVTLVTLRSLKSK